jgi:hypothetical protein
MAITLVDYVSMATGFSSFLIIAFLNETINGVV